MRQALTVVGTAIISSALTSAFWLVAFNKDNVAEARPVAAPPVRATPVAVVPDISLAPGGMAIPVAGIKPAELLDTYKQARAGGARVHDAIDIMAPSGTPVVAATAGRLEKLFDSKGGGGITAYVRSVDGRWSYYYAHMQEYAPGLVEGMSIKRGQMLGRVGYTGNANPAGPHLHFAVNRMGPDDKFWQGEPVNPYPLLMRRSADRR